MSSESIVGRTSLQNSSSQQLSSTTKLYSILTAYLSKYLLVQGYIWLFIPLLSLVYQQAQSYYRGMKAHIN